MGPEIKKWVLEHFNKETYSFSFTPEELVFSIQLVDSAGDDNAWVTITPRKYWKETGYLFDQHFSIKGIENFPVPAAEGTWDLIDDDEHLTRQFLLNCGITEELSL